MQTNFGNSSIDIELVYDDRSNDPDILAKHKSAIIIGIMRIFKREGIMFAYPTQTTFTSAPDGTMVMPYAAVQPVVALPAETPQKTLRRAAIQLRDDACRSVIEAPLVSTLRSGLGGGMTGITIDELTAMTGREIGTSRWFEISQDRIGAFADATEDHQFIQSIPPQPQRPLRRHHRPRFPFPLADVSNAYDALPKVDGVTMMVNYGFDRVRFLAPGTERFACSRPLRPCRVPQARTRSYLARYNVHCRNRRQRQTAHSPPTGSA